MATGYFGMGPETRAFEYEIESYIGAGRNVRCVNSGTAALQLAVVALGLVAGDEVLVPTLTFVASFQAVAAAGAIPVACDVRSDNGLLDLDDARRRVSRRTRAVMPVHYAGNPGDLHSVYEFAAQYGLRVVEDAAHAFGSQMRDGLVGGSGDLVCFSFDPIKNITCGQGGAVVSASETIAARVGEMRNLGIETLPGADFEVSSLGWRFEMSDLMAAVGRAQLKRFETVLKPARQALAAAYRTRLSSIRGVTLLDCEPGAVQHIFPVRVRPERRAAIRVALSEAGYETRVHYKPNHFLRKFADGGTRAVAESLYQELLTLPTHADVGDKDVEEIARVLEKHAGTGAHPARPGGA